MPQRFGTNLFSKLDFSCTEMILEWNLSETSLQGCSTLLISHSNSFQLIYITINTLNLILFANTSCFLPAGRGWRESGCSRDNNEWYLWKKNNTQMEAEWTFSASFFNLTPVQLVSRFPPNVPLITTPWMQHYSYKPHQFRWYPLFGSGGTCQETRRNHLCPETEQEMCESRGWKNRKEWMGLDTMRHLKRAVQRGNSRESSVLSTHQQFINKSLDKAQRAQLRSSVSSLDRNTFSCCQSKPLSLHHALLTRTLPRQNNKSDGLRWSPLNCAVWMLNARRALDKNTACSSAFSGGVMLMSPAHKSDKASQARQRIWENEVSRGALQFRSKLVGIPEGGNNDCLRIHSSDYLLSVIKSSVKAGIHLLSTKAPVHP